MEEQLTLMGIHLCDNCKSYPCAHVVEMKKEYGSEPQVRICDGYKKIS